MTLKPLIAICGTTGVGKSKLAIELALALSQSRHGGYSGARIINADAMQVYAGLDILTNKVPLDEQCGVEHLLMGFKSPGEQYVVGEWVRDAMRLIDETHARNQIPIVVGGTSYWIQHLIFPERLSAAVDASTPETSRPMTPTDVTPATERSQALLSALTTLPPELLDLFNNLPASPPTADDDPQLALSLHKLLSALDPLVAQRWHWRDTRKVMRSLVIMKQSGRLPSEIINEQSHSVSQPRYRTLCFWLYSLPKVLNPRLDERVDQMLKQGLLDEVMELRNARTNPEDSDREVDGSSTDYTLGLYQSIGYREFAGYLERKPSMSTSEAETGLREAVDRMKISTRQYAKRQVSWLRNKLLPAAYAANREQADGKPVVPAFLLDATELGDKWESNVQAVARGITEDFLEERDLPDPLSLSDTAHTMLAIKDKPTNPNEVLTARRRIVCPTCTLSDDAPVMIEEGAEWAAHARTKRHRKLASGKKRRDERRSIHEHAGSNGVESSDVRGDAAAAASATVTVTGLALPSDEV